MNALRYTRFLSIILVLLLTFGVTETISAEEPNVGLLRVASVRYPRQVAPSAKFSMIIDIEYAIHINGTIKASLFEGSLKNLGAKLWESEPIGLAGGGDKIWAVNLTAPSGEQKWALTVIAYYLEAGKWSYYNEAFSGPGYAEMTLKVARLAELQVDLGIQNIPVSIDASTNLTSTTGQIKLQLPVGKSYHIAIPPAVQFDNSTRVVFAGWQGGPNVTQRTVTVDGDSKIVGFYKRQYLLQMNSIAPGYSNSTWYDAGSKATLMAKTTIPMSWPLGLLGLSYNFKGWSSGEFRLHSAQYHHERTEGRDRGLYGGLHTSTDPGNNSGWSLGCRGHLPRQEANPSSIRSSREGSHQRSDIKGLWLLWQTRGG